MSAGQQASSIRAFTRWRQPSVYAGEEIECIITFKNIALPPVSEKERNETHASRANGTISERPPSYAPSPSQSRRSSIVQGKAQSARAPSVSGNPASPRPTTHRPTLSLNVVSGSSRSELQSATLPVRTPNNALRGHGRSLSIMSLGSEPTSEGRVSSSASSMMRPSKKHVRSTSLQFMPKTKPQAGLSTVAQPKKPRSPLYESSTPPTMDSDPPLARPARRRIATQSEDHGSQVYRRDDASEGASAAQQRESLQILNDHLPSRTPSSTDIPKVQRIPSTMHSGQQRSNSPRRPSEGWVAPVNNLNPISRVMSVSSATGTPRSSSEFFSLSNHSDETLTSEIPAHYQHNGRLLPKAHPRQRSRPPNTSTEPESLMMGFAQTMGQFTLDGSLVNAAPFEDVKRKGVQGGGGVVGMERSKRSSGMFGAFSWGNLGESLGGLLGGDDMSSLAQMKATVGSKSVPLLSTPQNLLFVDLQLAPGESKSFNYRFVLPRGLPPSHRGRAIKVSYHLALGIQRPKDQTVKFVEIPFRVLGSYNARGESLGHNLMSPYVFLQDAAESQAVESPDSNVLPLEAVRSSPQTQKTNSPKTPKQGLEDFLRYTERLLEQPKGAGGNALVSPTSKAARSESLPDPQSSSVKEHVDFAILRANHVERGGRQHQADAQSANRFNIARAGQPVAILTLLRPAYKLGEPVIGTIDFSVAGGEGATRPSPVYSVVAELESAEQVDPSLALRSSNSIHRVTRRIHGVVRENTLFCRQVGFTLGIPSTAAPTFETTGVSHVWRLRVEFTTERTQGTTKIEGQAAGEGDAQSGVSGELEHALLEEIGSDDRGITLVAKEHLPAESFEITVPLKVYGAPGLDAMHSEQDSVEV